MWSNTITAGSGDLASPSQAATAAQITILYLASIEGDRSGAIGSLASEEGVMVQFWGLDFLRVECLSQSMCPVRKP